MLARIFVWVSFTSLGIPVDPLVYIMMATSSASGLGISTVVDCEYDLANSLNGTSATSPSKARGGATYSSWSSITMTVFTFGHCGRSLVTLGNRSFEVKMSDTSVLLMLQTMSSLGRLE